MKITKIEAQVKTKGRFSVFVDGKFVFGLSENGLLSSGIKLGQEIDETEMKRLKKLSDTDKLYSMALHLIARRPRSKKELQDYLYRKTKSEEESTEILNMLSNASLVDDEDFARRWVESRRFLKPISTRKLTLELRQKGINSEIINRVLSADQTDELAVLKQLVAKKRTQSRYQDDLKLMQYLTRQGFSYQDIREALKPQAD